MTNVDVSAEKGRGRRLPEMGKFQHIIVTRFNLKRLEWIKDRKGRPVQTPEWMDHRIKVFEKYCFPSMKNQSNSEFKWLVLFDNNTPDNYREIIKSYEEFACFTPRFLMENASQEVIIECINNAVDKDIEYLITTRIDNDDAFQTDAVEVIQSNFSGQSFEFMNLLEGCVLWKGRVFSVQEPSNPFITLVEKRTEQPFKTVHMAGHHLLSKYGPIKQISGGPYWLRVIHERNVLNCETGIRYSRNDLKTLFPFLFKEKWYQKLFR